MFKRILISFISLVLMSVLVGCQENNQPPVSYEKSSETAYYSQDDLVKLALENSDKTYIELNGNQSTISDESLTDETYIQFAPIDSLGRTGAAQACLGPETLPAEGEERESIGMIKPSGWQTKKYDKSIVDGMYLYNRCHQIAWCLSGLNAEEQNLMTGTRSFNVDGMLPFEDYVCDYIKETGNHVIYESTPIFQGDELVARALHLQARSYEDDGINFNVLIINKQDGITIDYSTGESELKKENNDSTENTKNTETYILNKNTKKIHKESCSSVQSMSPKNKETVQDTIEHLEDLGYTKCQTCLES